MRVRNIAVGVDGYPETVTVQLTAREAVWLAHCAGKHSPKSADEVLPGFAEENSAVYDCLTGELFNRYYDDGVREAARHLGSQR